MEREWSVCNAVVKGVVFVAGVFVLKSFILPAIGITSSGIVTGSIAERVYNFLVYTKGLIIPKNSFVDAFLSKYAGKKGLSLESDVHDIIDLYLNKLAIYACEWWNYNMWNTQYLSMYCPRIQVLFFIFLAYFIFAAY